MPKAEGFKLYKRGNVWHYRGTVAGKLYRGSTQATDEAKARRIVSEKEAKAWSGKLEGPAEFTFDQATVLYLDAGKSTRYVLSVNDYWTNTPVSKINGPLVLAGAAKTYPKAANSTRNRNFIAVTQAIINHAAKQGKCNRLFLSRLPEERRERDYADWDWVQAFIAVSDPFLAALAGFLFLTGSRISEAINVTWKQVDLVSGRVRIWQNKTKKERTAALPPELIQLLKEVPRGHRREGFVFPWAKRQYLQRNWIRAHKAAGIRPLGVHALRHGFATGLLRSGVDVVTVAKLGGWSSPQHIFSRYGHASEDIDVTNLLINTKSTQRK